jgi:hypothetical protein
VTTPAEPDPTADRPGRTHAPPVTTLRGAGTTVDPHRVAQVAVGLVLAALLVLTVAFALIGQHKNQQIDELRQQGVPVTVTVTACQELLGGSGSNGAGFACTGTYTLDGHRYSEPVPGTTGHAPGATIAGVAVPSDPTLLSTAQIVQSEHTSWNVYVLPAVFFVLFLLVVAAVTLRRRRWGHRGQAGGV